MRARGDISSRWLPPVLGLDARRSVFGDYFRLSYGRALVMLDISGLFRDLSSSNAGLVSAYSSIIGVLFLAREIFVALYSPFFSPFLDISFKPSWACRQSNSPLPRRQERPKVGAHIR